MQPSRDGGSCHLCEGVMVNSHIPFLGRIEHYYLCARDLVYSSVNQWTLGCFHTCGIVTNVAINREVHTKFSVVFPILQITRSEIAGSYASSIFNFVRNFLTFFP